MDRLKVSAVGVVRRDVFVLEGSRETCRYHKGGIVEQLPQNNP